MMNRTLLETAMLLLIASLISTSIAIATVMSPVQWVEDFGADCNGSMYSFTGSATVLNEALRLTPNQTWLGGRLV